MAGGRGSAVVGSAVLLCLLLLVHSSEMANAATYVVGGSNGWSYDVTSWTNGKRFSAGDVLVFNYEKAYHNVALVDEVGYNTCRVRVGSTVLKTGHDRVTLARGSNFFICRRPGHCQSGMKIAVFAS